jgi:hypothetical protein
MSCDVFILYVTHVSFYTSQNNACQLHCVVGSLPYSHTTKFVLVCYIYIHTHSHVWFQYG